MTDETADMSNREQLVIRWVGDEMESREYFLGVDSY